MANPPEDNNMSYSRFVPERWHPITKTGACLRSLGLGVGTQKSYHAKRPQLFETLVTTGVTEVTRGFSLGRATRSNAIILDNSTAGPGVIRMKKLFQPDAVDEVISRIDKPHGVRH